MRPTFATLALCSLTAVLLGACSRSAEEGATPELPDPATAAAPADPAPSGTEVNSAGAEASGAAAISFNAQSSETDGWYVTSEGATTCMAGASPAQEVERLRATGASPSTSDANAADGSLFEVVVKWTDERGQQSMTFYRKLGDCEATLPSAEQIPARYK